MKKAIKKVLSVMLVAVIMLTAAPLSGFVGLELPEWMNFSVWVNAATSNTTIDFPDDMQKHLLGSNFSITANYSSDTYSHNPETISCEISGPENGLIYNGMSCLGTPDDGFVGVSFTASKVGKYVVTLTTTDGATDSIDIEITTESLNEFLANAIQNKYSIPKTEDILLYKPNMDWTFGQCFFTALGEGTGIDLSETEIVEIMMIRVLVEKLTHDDFIEQIYAEAASDITKCIQGIQAIDKSVTQNTNIGSLSSQVKNYINDFYNIDVFDTLSSAIGGATTLINSTQIASFYTAVSENINAEQLRSMMEPIVPLMYSYSDKFSVALLENAYTSLFDVIENVDIKIADYFADTAVKYGLETLKDIIKDVTVFVASTAITAVNPALGVAFSTTMSAIDFSVALDSLFNGKLDGAEKALGIVNMLGELYYEAIYYYTSSEDANQVVESYRFLIATNQIAVDIQKDNLNLLKSELMKNTVIQPSLSVGVIQIIDMMGSKHDDVVKSYSEIAEKYSLSMDYCDGLIDNEREFLLRSVEEYLLYVYGSDVYLYNSDLWEIPTRYTITYSQNYSNNTFDEHSEIHFAYEGEQLDERMRPSSRSGYDFIGWYTDAECTNEYNFSNIVTSDLTLYAGWRQIIEYEKIDDVNSRVTGVNFSDITTYALTRILTQYATSSSTSLQIDVIIPICMDNHIVNTISSGAIPVSVYSIFIPESVTCIETGAIPMTTTIYCESDTYAESYAIENGYNYTCTEKALFWGTCGENLTWIFNTNTGTLNISGVGEMDDFTYYESPWENHEDAITSITISSGVTKIGNYAFYGCKVLTDITIPDSVTTIGKRAFPSNLVDITVDKNNDYYLSENGVLFNKEKTVLIQYPSGNIRANYIIPSSVTEIGQYAFYWADNITEITLSNNITTINENAFCSCVNLSDIELGDNITSIGESAFYNTAYYNDINNWENNVLYINNHLIKAKSSISGDYEIKDGTLTIADCAFYNCTSLMSIAIPNSAILIGLEAFYECTSLAWVTIGQNIKSIGEGAFYNCSNLSYVNYNAVNCKDTGKTQYINDRIFGGCNSLVLVNIGDSVRTIPAYLFYDIDSLTTITGGNGLLNIREGAFQGCDRLKEFIIPANVQSIDDAAFYRCLSLEEVVIPDSVTTIGNSSFAYCSNLRKVTIGFGLKEIAPSSFNDCELLEEVSYNAIDCTNMITQSQNYNSPFFECDNLSKINIGNHVEVIPTEMFAQCKEVKEINFGGHVNLIGKRAFALCYSLTSVTLPDSIKEIQESAFEGCSGLKDIYFGTGLETIGRMAFDGCESLEGVHIETISSWCNIDFDGYSWVSNPLQIADGLYLNGELITKITIPNDVNKIGSYSFIGYDKLTELTISDSVTSIGEGAFQSCSSLKVVTFGDNLKTVGSYAFAFCEALQRVNAKSISSWSKINFHDYLSTPLYYTNCLYYNNMIVTEVMIPEGVTSIGKNAFNYCDTITSVTVPSTVKSVGEDAFAVCNKIQNVYINDLASWCEISFGNAQSNPLMGDTNLYINKTQPSSLNIPEGTSHIGSYAFCCWYNCPQIVIIPDSVSNIGESAFEACRKLTTITMSNNIEQIGKHAFWGCYELESIVIPQSTSIIDDGAFSYCSSLDIVVDANNNYYTSDNGVLFNKDETTLIFCNKSMDGIYKIPNSVTSIKDYAFDGCGSLVGIIIPNSVKHIGENAICNNFSLNHIYYEGTTEEWASIDSNLGDNYYFNSAVFHYEATSNDISVQTDDSTCALNGKITYTCCLCNSELFTKTLAIAPHNKDVIDNKLPSCTEGGFDHYYCNMCDSYYTDSVSALGHNFYDNECIRCGQVLHIINVGDVLTASIESSGDIALFRFVPEVSSTYYFYSISTDDTYGYLYDDNMNLLAINDDNGDYSNFLISYSFIAGETYYLGAKLLDSINTGEFIVRLSTEYAPNLNELVSDEGVVAIPESNDIIPTDTMLNVILLETTDVSKTYDITLTSNGIEIQPNGMITVKLPVPDGVDGNLVLVYRCEADGTYTNMGAANENGYMIFITDHFSKYMMTLEDLTTPDEPEYNYTFSIQSPSRTEIRHKDGIKLHASVEGAAPAGSYVVWTASNSKFKTEEINNGNSLKIVSDKNGYTTFTATLYSADGEVLATDTIEMKSKAGFFDKLGSFFRSLFGTTKIYES